MHKLFLFAIFLIGCVNQPTYQASPFDKPEPVPTIIARGTDSNVSWKCQLEEMNSKLVWIPCEFHNEKSVPSSTCIKVTFYDQLTMKPIVESRKVCSGPLEANENKTNYVAFIKEKRETLQRCGEVLNLCVMLARKSQ